MPVYNYIATDSNGMRRTGFVDARTEELALSLLKNQGLYVVSLNERRDSLMDSFMDLRGVPENEIINFTRQFSTMISAGLPLSRALEVLTDQTNNKKMKKVLTDVLRDVEGGSPLSGALSRYPKIFNRTYQALIKAGESSGKLDEILKKLAQTMEDQRELLSNFKSAMIYPTIVFFAMIGVFVMMMVFVIPKLASMYDSMNIELPGMTKFMIQISRLFSDRFPVLLIITVVTTLAVRSFLKSDAGKEFKSFAAFNLPIFGKINRQKELTQLASTLSLLIASAVPIVESLKIVSEVVGNKVFREAALEAAARVEKGNQLSEYFRMNKNFPALFSQMASVGEETGQLDSALFRVSEYFSGEVDHSVKGLSAALEPVILIMLGSMVGLLIISIITPIYKITSSL